MQIENYILPVASTGQDLEVRATHSFNRYLLRAYRVPGTILAAGNQQGSKKKNPCSHGLYIYGKQDVIILNKNRTCSINGCERWQPLRNAPGRMGKWVIAT